MRFVGCWLAAPPKLQHRAILPKRSNARPAIRVRVALQAPIVAAATPVLISSHWAIRHKSGHHWSLLRLCRVATNEAKLTCLAAVALGAAVPCRALRCRRRKPLAWFDKPGP